MRDRDDILGALRRALHTEALNVRTAPVWFTSDPALVTNVRRGLTVTLTFPDAYSAPVISSNRRNAYSGCLQGTRSLHCKEATSSGPLSPPQHSESCIQAGFFDILVIQIGRSSKKRVRP